MIKKFKELNHLLSKVRFAVTNQEDVADVMMRDELEEDYDDSFISKYIEELLIDNRDNIYIQSYKKKIYMKIESNVYELFFIDRLDRVEYFSLMEQLSKQKRCIILEIEEYKYKGLMNHYEGVSLICIRNNRKLFKIILNNSML